MKESEYIPRPLDTSDIDLPSGLADLVEIMARNVHEVWAQSRISQGWKLGPERSDALRTHPCLVPYDQLTEEEKDYDRNTAVQTLKLILKSGFTLTPPHP